MIHAARETPPPVGVPSSDSALHRDIRRRRVGADDVWMDDQRRIGRA